MKIIEYGKQNSEIIILLHGGGLSWWNYRSEAQLLDDRYHVVLPVLDGHADSDADFISIEENARRIISFIDTEYGGSVLLIGGLSLGAQILVEMLSQRGNICQCAIIESASIIPSRVTNAMIGPAFALMLNAVTALVDVPVVASGGAGCMGDFVTLFREAPGVDAGLAASIFHFGEVPIRDLKAKLAEEGINIRRIS